MMLKPLSKNAIFGGLIALLMVGCASTVEDRIQSRQEAFNAYPVEVQARLKQRQIRLGDDTDAVWIAFGAPTTQQYRIDAEGRTEIWIYKYLTNDSKLVNAVHPVYRDIDGRLRGSYYIDDRPEYVWKESLRVEFKNGRVVAVEGIE
jgi:hypothetical protein